MCDEHGSMASADNAGDVQNPDRSSRDGTDDSASRSTYQRGTTDSVLPLRCSSNNDNAAKINGVRCGPSKTQATRHTDRVSTRVDSRLQSNSGSIIKGHDQETARRHHDWRNLSSRQPQSLAKAIVRTMVWMRWRKFFPRS